MLLLPQPRSLSHLSIIPTALKVACHHIHVKQCQSHSANNCIVLLYWPDPESVWHSLSSYWPSLRPYYRCSGIVPCHQLMPPCQSPMTHLCSYFFQRHCLESMSKRSLAKESSCLVLCKSKEERVVGSF